jgi:hypothetical protein
MLAGHKFITTMEAPRDAPIRTPMHSPMHSPIDVQTPLLPTLSLAENKSMPLPPEAIYSSKQELYTSIQAWAAQYHYAFRIERSKKINNSTRTRILYSCDRAGPVPPINHSQHSLQDRKRQTATRKTGCQFSVLAVECTDTQWVSRFNT